MRSRLALSLLIALPALASAHGAHVHGIATLDVALDGEQLTAHLEMPGDTLVGFERPPADDAERAKLAEAKAVLSSPPRWIAPSLDAGCALTANTLDASGFAAAHGGHADVDVELAWRCAVPARLDALDVLLFGHFPRLERVTVNLVLPDRQDTRVLTPGATRVRLAP